MRIEKLIRKWIGERLPQERVLTDEQLTHNINYGYNRAIEDFKKSLGVG